MAKCVTSFVLFLIVVNVVHLAFAIQPQYNVTKHIRLEGFNEPEGIALGRNGDIFVSDSKNNLVKRIDSNNYAITIVAGNGTAGNDTNTNATSAMLNYPCGLTVTTDGKLLIVDSLNHAIREVSSNGTIRTIAGKLGVYGLYSENVLATNSFLRQPKYITALSNGDIYVSDSMNARIRKISASSGLISTQQIVSTQLNGLAVFSSTEMITSETASNRLSRNSSNIISTIGSTAGFLDGNILNAKFNSPTGLSYGPSKEIYIADRLNHAVRVIKYSGVNGTVSLISGIAGISGNDTVRLNNPFDVAVNSQNEVFILDSGNNRIRKLTPYCNSTYFYNVTLNECLAICSGIVQDQSGVCLGRGSCISPDNCSCFNSSLWGGNNCQIPKCGNVLATSSAVCSNSNGQCIAPNNCSCLNGYSGVDCEQFSCFGLQKNASNVCSGRGSCVSLNNCTCQPGFYGAKCENYNCFGVRYDLKSVCSSVGNCSAIDTCNCTKPYYGKNCEIYECYGKAVNSTNVCSSKGVCSAIDNCTCSQGYYGNECQKFDCFGVNSLNSTVCSSSGNCTQYNSCVCKSGFYGSNCELFDCFGKSRLDTGVCSSSGSCLSPNNCSCQLGYFGSNCETFNCSRVANNQTVCKNGNQCSSSGRCSCSIEWGGDKCDKVKCYNITYDNSTVCSGKGSCSGYNNCTCNKDYYSFDCSLTKCYGILSNNGTVCSGKGKCQNPNQCACQNGYSGNQCQYNICYGKVQTDSSGCSGHGQCISPDNCKCSNNYVGSECEMISVSMDIENAIIYSYSDTLNNYLNDSIVDDCQKIIDKNEIYKLGQSELVTCQWRSYNLKIYLGFDHSITNGTIIKTLFGFSIRIDLISLPPVSVFPIMDLPDIIPSNQDLIIRSYLPSTYHHFKRTSQSWSSSTSLISSWLKNYSNKTIIRIPYNSILSGVGKFDIMLNSSNDQNFISSSSKTITLSSSLTPSFGILTSREENCNGNYDCLFEVGLLSLNSSLSFEISGVLNPDLLNKQMFRILKRNVSSNVIKVTAIQSESSLTSQLNYAFSIPTNQQIDFRLTNVNRTYSLNTQSLIVGLESDDPLANSLSPSYSWYCYRTTADKSTLISQNLCSGNTNQLSINFNTIGSEGMLKIGVNVSISESSVYSYVGFIDLVNSDISVPKITPDYISSVSPSGKSLVLHCIVESDSSIVQYGWKVVSGKLRNSPNLQAMTVSNILVGNSIDITLSIDSKYLIEGEWYEFELNTVNSVGSSKLSLSTRIDTKPRFTCSVDNLKNERNFTAYESLVSINCISLPQDRISSVIMEIDSPNERLFIISNTLKKSFVTTLPFNKDNLILKVKMINEFGSITEFTKNLTINLPDKMSSNLISRINYVRDELTILKQSKPLTIDTINYLNALLSFLQTNDNFSSLDDESMNKLVSVLIDMLQMMKDIPYLSYRVDEKVVQLIVPSLSNIYKIMSSISNTNMNADLEWWLNWIFTAMKSARQYYSTNLYNNLLDSKHFDEINNLKTIFSNIYSNNATKQSQIAHYNFEYYQLTGQSTSDGTSSIQVLQVPTQINSKTFNISKDGLNVRVSFPSDFTTQIQTIGSKSIIFSDLTMINKDYSNGNIMNIRPSLELSIFSKDNNLIKVENLVNPIIFKFEGLYTNNKTSINASCVFLDSSNNWSQSGIKTSLTITKRLDDLMYFDMECQVSHLSLFTIQELPFINPVLIPPSNPTTSAKSSDNRDNIQQETNGGAIAAAIVIPILFVVILLIVIFVILLIVFVRLRKRPSKTPINVAAMNEDIELVSDSLPSQAKYVKPSSAYSFQLDNAFLSENFHPHIRYTNITRIITGNSFQVMDTITKRPKIIKMINFKSEEHLNKFFKDAIHLMNTTNPHICKINEMFLSEADQSLCIDMDYIELGDFSKLTNSNFVLSEKLIKQIIYQSCLALEFAHCTAKTIHGNVKISNLLINSLNTDNIESMISDFGLLCFGPTPVNPIFASPEMLSGSKYYFNTDIFSIGVVLYQIMTKDISTSISELYKTKDQQEVVQSLSKSLQERYSGQVVELVLSMLEKDNLTRPQAQDILSHPMLSEFKKRK